MRHALARGRIFPQSYSTDRRYGRLSLKAIGLFPLIWVNADDQGRLTGDHEEVKYCCCPNIDHITKGDIPGILEELQANELIKRYDTPKSSAIQLLDWWDVQKLQWAWPSEYAAPEGWQDRLRYKQGASTVITENWGTSGEKPGEHSNGTQVSTQSPSGENPGETAEKRFPPLLNGTIKGKGRGRGKGKGNSPENSGEQPTGPQVSERNVSGEPPSASDPSPSLSGSFLLQALVSTYQQGWGLTPNHKANAQLRDLGEEISAGGGATAAQVHDAFLEAAELGKLHVSYVRAVLLAWLGISRDR